MHVMITLTTTLILNEDVTGRLAAICFYGCDCL